MLRALFQISAFSRGCLLRSSALRGLLLHPSPVRSSIILFRLFTSTSTLQAAKKKRPKQPRGLPAQSVIGSASSLLTAPPRPATSYQTYADVLAHKPHGTLLYTAPSSTVYAVSSYLTSFTCFAYGIGSYWNNYLCAPTDIAVWIPYAFVGVAFAMVLFSIRLARNPFRLIRQVMAVPQTRNGKPRLQIHVELKKMLPVPFFPPRVLSVAPHEIVIPQPLVSPAPGRPSLLQFRRSHLEEEKRKQAMLEYERTHVMSAGVRHMGRAISTGSQSMVQAVARIFSRDGFLELKIHGRIYKMDLAGGWLLDHGRAIDRLVTLEPHVRVGWMGKVLS